MILFSTNTCTNINNTNRIIFFSRLLMGGGGLQFFLFRVQQVFYYIHVLQVIEVRGKADPDSVKITGRHGTYLIHVSNHDVLREKRGIAARDNGVPFSEF